MKKNSSLWRYKYPPSGGATCSSEVRNTMFTAKLYEREHLANGIRGTSVSIYKTPKQQDLESEVQPSFQMLTLKLDLSSHPNITAQLFSSVGGRG